MFLKLIAFFILNPSVTTARGLVSITKVVFYVLHYF